MAGLYTDSYDTNPTQRGFMSTNTLQNLLDGNENLKMTTTLFFIDDLHSIAYDEKELKSAKRQFPKLP